MVNIDIIGKVKNQIGMWRISRYTKRRTYVTIDQNDHSHYSHDDVENEKIITKGRGGKTRAARFNTNRNNRDAAHLLTTSTAMNNESEIIDKRATNYSESYSITAAPL